MSRAVALRLCRASNTLFQQPGLRHSNPATAAATASVPRRDFAADSRGSGRKNGSGASGEAAVDEDAARRAALLKRYGDRTASSGPVAVKADPGAADASTAADAEASHNEIWGDYVRYMEHQRKKGWKT